MEAVNGKANYAECVMQIMRVKVEAKRGIWGYMIVSRLYRIVAELD
jgi:hypothetical protein